MFNGKSFKNGGKITQTTPYEKIQIFKFSDFKWFFKKIISQKSAKFRWEQAKSTDLDSPIKYITFLKLFYGPKKLL